MDDVTDAALAGLTGHELHLGDVADLDVGNLTFGHLDHGKHRIETDDLGDLLAGEGERRSADLRNLGDHAVPGRGDDATVALGFGRRKRGLRSLVLRFQVVELQPRNGVGRNQPPLRIQFNRALIEQRFCLQHLGLARIVRQDGDDVAFLHDRAAANPQLLEQAVGTGEAHDLAVGFGTAGQNELAAVRDHVGVDDRHAEALLGLCFAHPKRRFALCGFVRNEMSGHESIKRRQRPDRPP